MVEVRIDGNAVVFEILGLHKLWALRSRVRVRLANVRDVRVVADLREVHEPGRTWFRAPGTHIPGLIKAGSFLSEGRSVFWAVGRRRPAIVVELAHEGFDRLVVEVADPAHAVEALKAARARA